MKFTECAIELRSSLRIGTVSYGCADPILSERLHAFVAMLVKGGAAVTHRRWQGRESRRKAIVGEALQCDLEFEGYAVLEARSSLL